MTQKYYNPVSLADADEIVPQVGLAKLIARLAPPNQIPERIINMAPEYLKNLSIILSETPDEIVHDYFLWKQIQAFGPYVEAAAVDPLRRFSNELQGKVRHAQAFNLHNLTNLGP